MDGDATYAGRNTMNADTQPVNVPFPVPQTRLLSYHNWIHLNPDDRVIVKRT
jgi:hypothetical protein